MPATPFTTKEKKRMLECDFLWRCETSVAVLPRERTGFIPRKPKSEKIATSLPSAQTLQVLLKAHLFSNI